MNFFSKHKLIGIERILARLLKVASPSGPFDRLRVTGTLRQFVEMIQDCCHPEPVEGAAWRSHFQQFTASTYSLPITLLLLLFAPYAVAQTKVQVVSKTIERELTDVNRLVINVNKSDLVVKGWNKSSVGLTVRMVAKHPDRAIAERELAYLSYDLRTKNGIAELTNRYTIPQTAGKVQSVLGVTLELSVPQRMAVGITSSFGDIDLSELTGEVSIKYEFGKLIISNLSGKTTATSAYGDLEASNTAGQLTLKTEKANVLLRGLSGSASLQCRYGKLTIRPDADLSALTVTANRTEIMVVPRRLDDFRYDLRNTYADINVPGNLRESLGTFVNKQVFDYDVNPRKPLIRIDNSYSTITLQTIGSTESLGGK